MNEIGYDLEHIGLKIVLGDGTGPNPDLSFKSHKANHLLLIEAKSGSVDNEQAKKYKSLTPADISRLGLTALPAPPLTIDVCYACTRENRESVLANEARYQWGFPIITYDGTVLRKEKTNAKFSDPALENLFAEGISFERDPSYSFYPFGEGDSPGWVVESVLFQLAILWTRGKDKFTVDELVQNCHPLIGYFDRDQVRQIIGLTRSALIKISQSGSRRFSIKQLKGQEWQIVKFGVGRFTRKYISLFADTFDARGQTLDLERYFKEATLKAEAEEEKEETAAGAKRPKA